MRYLLLMVCLLCAVPTLALEPEDQELTVQERNLKRWMLLNPLLPHYYKQFWQCGGCWHPDRWHRGPYQRILYKDGVPQLNLAYKGPRWTREWAYVAKPPRGVPLTEAGEQVYISMIGKLRSHYAAKHQAMDARQQEEWTTLTLATEGLVQ